MEIRQLTSDDLTVANDIAMQAYQMPSRMEELRRYLRLQPDGWFLAWEGDRAVGLAGTIDYGPLAYVGLVSVLPAAQRGGIGRALMQHILAWLDARSCPMILLDASPVGQPLYAQLGFVVDDSSVVWRRETASPPSPETPERLPGVQPLTVEDVPEIVAYDAPRFGADRAALLADLLASYPGRAALTRDAAGRICGFAIAQANNLGPWLADDPTAATALMAWALALPSPPIGALVPAQNRNAAEVLTATGFTIQRRLAHMRLGGAKRNRDAIYGLASFTLS